VNQFTGYLPEFDQDLSDIPPGFSTSYPQIIHNTRFLTHSPFSRSQLRINDPYIPPYPLVYIRNLIITSVRFRFIKKPGRLSILPQ